MRTSREEWSVLAQIDGPLLSADVVRSSGGVVWVVVDKAQFRKQPAGDRAIAWAKERVR